jgi:hypothetical protein
MWWWQSQASAGALSFGASVPAELGTASGAVSGPGGGQCRSARPRQEVATANDVIHGDLPDAVFFRA